MEVKLTTSELEFQKWFPEIDSRLWKNIKIKRIVIECDHRMVGQVHIPAKAFEFNPMAPREGAYRVHINWSSKDFDGMRTKLRPILRTTLYGNFADVYTSDVAKLLEEIQIEYPNSILGSSYQPHYDYSISIRD